MSATDKWRRRYPRCLCRRLDRPVVPLASASGPVGMTVERDVFAWRHQNDGSITPAEHSKEHRRHVAKRGGDRPERLNVVRRQKHSGLTVRRQAPCTLLGAVSSRSRRRARDRRERRREGRHVQRPILALRGVPHQTLSPSLRAAVAEVPREWRGGRDGTAGVVVNGSVVEDVIKRGPTSHAIKWASVVACLWSPLKSEKLRHRHTRIRRPCRRASLCTRRGCVRWR